MRRTLSTTRYRRGEVILVNFVFSEETGVKRRPAVVVSSQAYNRGRQEAIIAAVTSNVGRLLVGDHLIAAWKEAGLLYPSVLLPEARAWGQLGATRLRFPDLAFVPIRDSELGSLWFPTLDSSRTPL